MEYLTDVDLFYDIQNDTTEIQDFEFIWVYEQAFKSVEIAR